jgi:hypothetical protein
VGQPKPLPELPRELIQQEAARPLQKPSLGEDWSELWQGVPEGERHNTALRLAGHLLGKKLKPGEVRELLFLWNERNIPPLPEEELERIVNDLADKERSKREENTTALPENCCLGILRDFVELMAPHYEVPKEYWFFSLATVLGAALAGKMTLAGDLKVEPRLYTVLLGRSGVEKKSTAIRRTLKFAEGAGVLPPVCFGVGSGEGLAEALQENKTLLLAVDEFRTLMAKARIENSVLGPMLASLFEGNNFESRTKAHKVTVRGARLSMLAASTYDSYALTWDAHSLAVGLTNRILIVPAETDRLVPLVGQVPLGEEQRLQARLRELFATLEEMQDRTSYVKIGDTTHEVKHKEPVELTLTPEAEKIWRTWYLTRSRDLYSVRLDAIGQRLMVIFAFAQGNFREVDANTVRGVCDLLDWQHKARMAYDPIDAGNEVARMEEAIRRQLRARGPLRKRELKRRCHAERAGEWVFRTALSNLTAEREVVFDRRTKCFTLAEG